MNILSHSSLAFSHVLKISTILFTFILFSVTIAQEVEKKNAEEKSQKIVIKNGNSNSIKDVNETTGGGDKIIFKDGSTELMAIENVGGGGALYLPGVGPLSITDYLYNDGMNLWWGDQQITSSDYTGFGAWAKMTPDMYTIDNVSIGYPSTSPQPGYQLYVEGASGFGGYFNSPGASSFAGYFNGNVHVTGNISSDGAFPGDNDWTFSGTDIFNSNIGNVGIGLPSPLAKLHINGGSTGDALIVADQSGFNTFRISNNRHVGINQFYNFISMTIRGTSGDSYIFSVEDPAGGFAFDIFGDGNAQFYKDLTVLGTFTNTAALAKIDHPLDPTNKNLTHSFVESEDMMNIYNGNIILNSSGEANVTMADWFEALNMEFRYQLTAIGAPGPNLYIAEKISNNQFRIAGGSAGMEVSWQVTGIRQDAYAKANRIQVEELKKPEEQGKYLHPTVFGQPETAGVSYSKKLERVEASVEN